MLLDGHAPIVLSTAFLTIVVFAATFWSRDKLDEATRWGSAMQRGEIAASQAEIIAKLRALADSTALCSAPPEQPLATLEVQSQLLAAVQQAQCVGNAGNSIDWVPEAPPVEKRQCLQETFSRGSGPHERIAYSQVGEDGIIEAVFNCIGHRDKYYVEFGAEDCTQCTSRYLRQQGWRGLVMDGSFSIPAINLQREWFTAENIVGLFEKYAVPMAFDHLTIDIDLNTFWVLHALLRAGYRPRSLTAEFNRNLPPFMALTAEYAANDQWDNTCYFGASPLALHRLLETFGYHIVALDSRAVNVYAVLADETGAEAPLPFVDVVHGGSGPVPLNCVPIHEPCSDRRWRALGNATDLTQPLAALLEGGETGMRLVDVQMIDAGLPAMQQRVAVMFELEAAADGTLVRGNTSEQLRDGCWAQ